MDGLLFVMPLASIYCYLLKNNTFYLIYYKEREILQI